MSFRATLIAMAVLAVIVGVLWLEYRSDVREGMAEERGRMVFTSGEGDSQEVTGIDLIRPDLTISLRKSAGVWSLTAPVAARADAGRVEGILATLSALEIQDRVGEPDADLAQYGLAPPLMEIVIVRRGGGGPGRLSVGVESPVGRARYARREGESAILAVSSSLGRLLDADAGGLRTRKVVGVDFWKIVSFSVESGGSRLAFRREGNGWRMESPEDFPADGEAVSSRLRAVASLSADGYAPRGATRKDLGLDRPSRTLEFEEEGGQRVTVQFAPVENGEGLWAVRSDMEDLFRLPAAAGKVLSFDHAALRDLRVAPVDSDAVSEIRLVRSGREMVLVRDAEARWRRESEAGAEVEPRSVGDLLGSLGELRAEDLLPTAGETSPGDLLLKLVLREGEGAPVEIRLLGRVGTGHRALSSASDYIYLLENGQVEKVLATVAAIWPPGSSDPAGRQTGAEGDF